jgi:hypothetical protein
MESFQVGAAVPITPFLDGEHFDAETRRIMGLAFEIALTSLRLSDRGNIANELIARKIIAAARSGERDPDKLCDMALAR